MDMLGATDACDRRRLHRQISVRTPWWLDKAGACKDCWNVPAYVDWLGCM
jgi:hypothetical protein